MLRRNRDLRTLFIAQVVSYMGDWFSYVALLGMVNDLTDSSLLVALVFVSQALPGFLVLAAVIVVTTISILLFLLTYAVERLVIPWYFATRRAPTRH